MSKKKGKKKSGHVQYDDAELRVFLKHLADVEDFGIEDVLDVEEFAESVEHAGERLARLAIYDLDPGVMAGAIAALKVILDSDMIDPDTMDDFVNETGPIILKGLESPNVPDTRKIDLVPICERTGYLSPQDDLGQYFEDLAGTMNRTMESTMDKFIGEPAEIGQLLLALWDSPEGQDMPEAMYLVAMEMARHAAVNNPAGASALASVTFLMGYEESPENEILEAAFLLLENENCPECVWWLNALAQWPSLGEWNERARRSASKKRLSGIQPHNCFSRTFSHAQITAWDGADARQLSLYFRTPNGELDAVSFLIKWDKGIRDLFIVAEEGSKVEEAIEEMDKGGISVAVCSWEQAMEYLADACAVHIEKYDALPPILLSMLPYFPDGFPKPMRRTVCLDAYDLSGVVRSPEMVSKSEALVYGPAGYFQFTSDATYTYIRYNRPRNGNKLSKKWRREFLEAIEEDEKPSLINRMESLLEIEALAGRAQEAYSGVLLNTWIALAEGLVPFATIPLVNELADLSVPGIVENVQIGILSQAAANDFFSSLISSELMMNDDEFGDEFEENDRY